MRDLLEEAILQRFVEEAESRHVALMQLQRVGVLRDTEMELIQLWADKFHHGKLEEVHLGKDKVEMRELTSQVRDILRACTGLVRDVRKVYPKTEEWEYLETAADNLQAYVNLGVVTAEQIAAVVTFVHEFAEVGDRESEDRIHWVNAKKFEERREHKTITAEPEPRGENYPNPYPFRDITGIQVSKWFNCKAWKDHGLAAVWKPKKVTRYPHWVPKGMFAKVLYRLLRKLSKMELDKGKLGDTYVQFFTPGAPVKFHIPLELFFKEWAADSPYAAAAWDLAARAVAGKSAELDQAISKDTKSRRWFKLALTMVHVQLGHDTSTLPVDVFGHWPQVELRKAAGKVPAPLTNFLFKKRKPPAPVNTPPQGSTPPKGPTGTDLAGTVPPSATYVGTGS
jgi:hypothetical protein